MSSWPAVLPGPVMKLKTPGGSPASTVALYNLRPRSGVAVAGLKTTVLPATSAPPDGPAASARGKLNGAMTAQTPNGRITLKFCSPSVSVPICCTKPLCFVIWSQ